MTRTTVLIMLAILAVPASAQPAVESPSVTVVGTATTQVRATGLKIIFPVEGQAEEMDDALTKFRQMRTRVQEVLTSLSVPEDRTEVLMLSVGPSVAGDEMQVWRGGNETPPEVGYKVEITMAVEIAWAPDQELEDLLTRASEILDGLLDEGIDMGIDPMAAMRGQDTGKVQFQLVYPEFEDVREQLYQEALDDATSQAKLLAAAANRQLGGIRSISPGAANPALQQQMYYARRRPGEGIQVVEQEYTLALTVVHDWE
jgi:uncharacterized protein YggE